jgi:DNA-binding NarL/FixJ family response regulator
MLAAMPGFALAAAASSLAQAEQLVLRAQPDLVISDTDLAGESGIGFCRWARQASQTAATVILTDREEPLLVQSAIAAGVSGYLLKGSPPESLMANLKLAATGQRVLDERLGRTQRRRGHYGCTEHGCTEHGYTEHGYGPHHASHSYGEHGCSQHGRGESEVASESGLSRREREVLEEMLAGLANKAIASRLCISEDTVKSHVKSIFRKLGARDRAHALALALGTASLPDARLADSQWMQPALRGRQLAEAGAARGRLAEASAACGPQPRLLDAPSRLPRQRAEQP